MKAFGVRAGLLLGGCLVLAGCGRSASEPAAAQKSQACEGDRDCDDGLVCAATGACVQCNQDRDCGDGEQCSMALCSDGTGEPAPPEPYCEPGALSCDGGMVKRCSEDGSKLTIKQICSITELCEAGECLDIACVPNTKFCQAGGVWKCDAQATSATLSQNCDADEYCVTQDEDAECSASACFADDPMCHGNLATSCKPDGSGPKPGGDDCSELGQICYEGECRDQACVPGEKLCQHDDVYLCSAGGTDVTLLVDCASTEVCDPALAACRSTICEPGTLSCDRYRVVSCDALGLGYVQSGTDCLDTSQICDEGSCKTQICTPGFMFCENNDVHECDALGLSASLRETCHPSYYHCAPYYSASTAYCAYNSCTPGAAICDGNAVTKCKADASGPEPGGTDCGTSNVCVDALCKPKVCEAGQTFCKNGDVAQCHYTSLDYYISTDCGSDRYCTDTGGGGLGCAPFKCEPGLKGCVDNRLGVCGQSGLDLASVTQDCAAAGNVCTAARTCASTSKDVLGSAEEVQSVPTDHFFGNVVFVTSSRRLLELETNLVLAASRDLRWVVFEEVSGSYAARYDKLVSNQMGNGSFSSGPLSYVLKAGKTYLLGVTVSDGSSAAYYENTPWVSGLSFGLLTGSLYSSYSTTLWGGYYPASQVYQLTATTELP